MPRLDFDDENRTASIYDADRLRFKENGERARILILDEAPTAIYRHYIASPSASYKGRYYACLGDYATVKQHGKDNVNCPACVVGERGQDKPVGNARQNLAVNIAHYRTNSQGVSVTPISVAHSVWFFGPGVFSKLVDRKREHGDLRKRDIVLTCTAVQYQQLDIDVSGRCEAIQTDSGKEQLRACVKTSLSNDDLDTLLATNVGFDELQAAVDESGLEIGYAGDPPPEPEPTAAPPVMDADTLLDGAGDTASVSNANDLDLDDIFNS